jgi:hypothetical protein
LQIERLLLAPGRYRLRAVYRSEPDPAVPTAVNQYLQALFQSAPSQQPDALLGKFAVPESDETRWLKHMIEQSDIPPEIRRIFLEPQVNGPQGVPASPSTPVPWDLKGFWQGTIRSNPVRCTLTSDEVAMLKAPRIESLQSGVLPPIAGNWDAVNGATATEEQPRDISRANQNASLNLLIGKEETKSVTVTLGQTASEIVDLCRPARPYADDDPWLAYMASGGGSYLLLFTAEGTAEELRGKPDSSHDTLYAVVHYPTESKSDGEFLLPETMRERTCGDFVTLKVPIALEKVRAATVALGMNAADVMRLFQPALDHVEEDDTIILDAIDRGARYVLILSAQGDDRTLSEVVYRSGEDAESVYLLPRGKRGVPVPDDHRVR